MTYECLVAETSSSEHRDAQDENVVWKYCIYCGTAVVDQESKFCANCGASIQKPTTETFLRSEDEGAVSKDSTDNCMVCGSAIRDGDPILDCPHCGNVAHGVHLLEWLHVKGHCPICGQRLTELELSGECPKSGSENFKLRQAHSRKGAVEIMPRSSRGFSGLTAPGVLAFIGLVLLIWGLATGAVVILIVIAGLLIVSFIIIWFIASLGSPGSLGQRGQ